MAEELFSFEDLDLSPDEEVEVDVNDLPQEFSDIREVPQPGKGYVFQFPKITTTEPIFSKFEVGQGDDARQRFAVNLREARRDEEGFPAHPLVIVRSPFTDPITKQDRFKGVTVNYRISNAEQQLREGEKKGSEMAFLLVNGFGVKPADNKQSTWVKALVSVGGKQFMADVDWDAYCSEKRDKWAIDPETGLTSRVEGEVGCGTRYRRQAGKKPDKRGKWTVQLPRDEDTGEWIPRFECSCGAVLSVFVRLRRYRLVGSEQPTAGNGQDTKAQQGQQAQPAARPTTRV